MAKHVLDYDPLRGITSFFNYDHALEKVVISHEQDVTKELDLCMELRADTDRTKRGIRGDFVHYAIVPNVVQLEMLTKHGVDFWDHDQRGKMFALLNDEYSRFKVTEITHACR